MQFDHDKFLPPFVKLSTSPYCTNISSQYNGTHNNDNTQHGARYNSTERTPLPLPGKSQCTHLSTVNVHNNRPIDSAHFAQPMSHNSSFTSPSLTHVCSNRPANSTCIVSYIRRQYIRTVPNVDIIGSGAILKTQIIFYMWFLTHTSIMCVNIFFAFYVTIPS